MPECQCDRIILSCWFFAAFRIEISKIDGTSKVLGVKSNDGEFVKKQQCKKASRV